MPILWYGRKIEPAVECCDVLIIGSGLAGLYTALNLSADLSVTVLAKKDLSCSNSMRAQGGIAAALAAEDSPQQHLTDSLIAGAGLGDEKALNCLVREGPKHIHRLLEWNVPFDCDEAGSLKLAREAAHSRARIVRCHGDATGLHVTETLLHKAQDRESIRLKPGWALADFILDDQGRIAGCLAMHAENKNDFCLFRARQTILASGGFGGLFAQSTNDPCLTGDGLAACLRVGIPIKDLEFIQFHPTALYESEPHDAAFLISEAVRGEGAVLRNQAGCRFMKGVHARAELAPRDLVARAIAREMKRDNAPYVWLDATAFEDGFFPRRFPTIYKMCQKRHIDPQREWIPVVPSQHYCMGGVVTDLKAKTGAEGLLACGEVAMTGVYGANRLASNSLLECLVFGARAAQSAMQALSDRKGANCNCFPRLMTPSSPFLWKDDQDFGSQQPLRVLRQRMSRCCGILRDREELADLLQWVERQRKYQSGRPILSLLQLEESNLFLIAQAVIEAALQRRESLGAHHWQ